MLRLANWPDLNVDDIQPYDHAACNEWLVGHSMALVDEADLDPPPVTLTVSHDTFKPIYIFMTPPACTEEIRWQNYIW
jgi:hypothetical protein